MDVNKIIEDNHKFFTKRIIKERRNKLLFSPITRLIKTIPSWHKKALLKQLQLMIDKREKLIHSWKEDGIADTYWSTSPYFVFEYYFLMQYLIEHWSNYLNNLTKEDWQHLKSHNIDLILILRLQCHDALSRLYNLKVSKEKWQACKTLENGVKYLEEQNPNWEKEIAKQLFKE